MLVARWKYSVKARLVALTLATVFSWLCTGGTLRHSDACASCASLTSAPSHSSHSTANVRRSIAQAADDNCAACRWIQVARDLPADHALRLATVAASYEPFAAELPALPSLRIIRHASLRAPPQQNPSALWAPSL